MTRNADPAKPPHFRRNLAWSDLGVVATLLVTVGGLWLILGLAFSQWR